jgi:uncharacterized membrane protein
MADGDLVAYIPTARRWLVLAVHLSVFLLAAIAARIVFGTNHFLVVGAAIATLVVLAILTSRVPRLTGARFITRAEFERREDADRPDTYWQMAVLAGTVFSVIGWLSTSMDYPEDSVWDYVRHAPLFIAGGLIMGGVHVAMRRIADHYDDKG